MTNGDDDHNAIITIFHKKIKTLMAIKFNDVFKAYKERNIKSFLRVANNDLL